MKIQILVRLKPGVLDVQGKAVESALSNIGCDDADNVRIGKLIELDVEAKTFDEAKKIAQELSNKILINPIIENCEIRQA